MTIRDFVNHVYPSLSIEIYSQDDCRFIIEVSAGSIGLSNDKWYAETRIENWIIYESFARLYV